MKLSFTRTVRKMRNCYEVMELDNEAYFFEDGFVVGRVTNNELLQLFVQDGGEVKLLVLAKNMKRKCGQELIVADVIFIDSFYDDQMLRCIKRRKFSYIASDEVKKHGVRSIGSVQYTDDGIQIKIPKLAVEEEIAGLEDFDDRRVFVVSSRTKQTKTV